MRLEVPFQPSEKTDDVPAGKGAFFATPESLDVTGHDKFSEAAAGIPSWLQGKAWDKKSLIPSL